MISVGAAVLVWRPVAAELGSGPAVGRQGGGPAVSSVVPAVERQGGGPAVPSVSARPQRDGRIRAGFRRISSCVWSVMYRVFCVGFVNIIL